MIKALRISRSIRVTYQVNSILYSLKQIPILKNLLPAYPYRVRGLKVFAGILSLIWDILKIFGGKALYFLVFLGWAGGFEPAFPADQVYLYRILLLTLIGTLINTSFAEASYERYYAINLLRMNPRSYTLSRFGAELCKVMVGFLPFSLLFGFLTGVPLWFNLLLPLCVAGGKAAEMALELWHFETHNGAVAKRNLVRWAAAGMGLVLAYGLPMLGYALPKELSMGLLGTMIPLGLLSVLRILHFKAYKQLNQQVLAELFNVVKNVTNQVRNNTRDLISVETGITSDKKGFEYLNALFIKRHRNILWKATWIISSTLLALFAAGAGVLSFFPDFNSLAQELILQRLPYWSFLLYLMNRGTSFTRALFINCDHSLLTYSFYKQPKTVLKLFRIRLREICKINVVPALIIGLGLDGILLLSGGGTWVEYLVLPMAILSMNLFFSIHYLTLYYLLQPFNAGTEIKSGTYQFITGATYLACCLLMQVELSTMLFGLLCIVFCAAYSVVACVLVYRIAPRTFRIRP